MISYKEYYLKCIKNYNKSNSNQLIYNFGISVEKPNNFKYLKLDDTFYQLIDKFYDKYKKLIVNPLEIRNDNLFIGIENIYHFEEIEDIAQILIPQLEDKLFSSYLHLMRVYMYRNKITNNPESSSWLWHWDNHPEEIIKIIIYLTDVTEENGAFEYLRDKNTKEPLKMNTNRLGPNKWGNKNHPTYRGCRISYPQINEFINNGYETVKVTGKKGTIIIFDNNIVHKANRCKTSYRDILTLQVRPRMDKLTQYLSEEYTGSWDHCAQGNSNPLIFTL